MSISDRQALKCLCWGDSYLIPFGFNLSLIMSDIVIKAESLGNIELDDSAQLIGVEVFNASTLFKDVIGPTRVTKK
jgi:hypothetical protein